MAKQTTLEAARKYLLNSPDVIFDKTKDDRQVNPGAIVVDLETKEMYLCVVLEAGVKWVLVNVDTGFVVSTLYVTSTCRFVGLPLDRWFTTDPSRYVVFYNGKISKEMAGNK